LWLGTTEDNNQDCSLKGRYINQKGIKNPSAKLTERQVRQIRRQYAQGRKQCELVQQYHSSPTTIHNVVNRKTWTHI
jgi:Mor family transcriptional regulator